MRFATIGVLLMAVFALSAVASASAAELEQVPPEGGFKVLSGASTFITSGGTELKCEKDSGSGKLLGAKLDDSDVTFEKCKADGVSCTSSGAKSGNIETTVMSELVWLNKSTQKAGQKLLLTKPVKITCLIVSVEVVGSTLCPIEPVNTKTSKIVLPCKAGSKKGQQEFTTYLNEAGEKFSGITFSNGEESALTSTETLDLEKEGEIKVT
jgi:hypothetical protein